MNILFAAPPPPPGRGSLGPETRVTLFGLAQVAADLIGAVGRRGWRAEVGLLGRDERLARPDLVFNCIGDPGVHGQSLEILAAVIEATRIPVLNHPEAVMRCARPAVAQLLQGQAGVRVPRTSLYRRGAGPLAEHVRRAGHALPVLARPLGAHGGRGLAKLETLTAEPPWLAAHDAWIVSDFADFASADGLYRKHRAVYVDGRVFRRHLVIADDWKITGGARRFMVGKPDLIAEEKAFIAGPAGEAEDRLARLFRTLSLDFGVVDYALDDAGGTTVFELNPCFQLTGSIPAEKRHRWGYLEETNGAVIEAFLDAMAGRAGRGGASS